MSYVVTTSIQEMLVHLKIEIKKLKGQSLYFHWQTMSEKLCLQWNDFKENVVNTFGSLKEDKDFTDVTLACEDGKQVEAHKVILAASSPFFQDILKRNKHAHHIARERILG